MMLLQRKRKKVKEKKGMNEWEFIQKVGLPTGIAAILLFLVIWLVKNMYSYILTFGNNARADNKEMITMFKNTIDNHLTKNTEVITKNTGVIEQITKVIEKCNK